MDPLQQQVNRQIVQGFQLFLVSLGRGPRREKFLHPALGLQRPQHLQPVFLVANLLQFLAARPVREVLNYSFAHRVLVASPGLGVEFPAEPRLVPCGANQQGGLLKKTII